MEKPRIDDVKKMSGIYLIFDHRTQRGYVGQAVDIGRRWVFHLWELNAGRHSNKELQEAWNHHSNAFSFSVLETTEEDLNEREKWWIAHLDTYRYGFNKTRGGHSSGKRSMEARMHLSAALKGRVGAMTGKHFSEEHRRKISEKLKGNHNSGYGADNHASRPVVCLDTGMWFACSADA